MNNATSLPMTDQSGKLLVFSDDWGRHPSSCQHLVTEMLPRLDVTWVNTIGTRPPRLDLLTAKRVWGKLHDWNPLKRSIGLDSADQKLVQPSIIDTKMWPWMSHRWDRWLNEKLLCRQLNRVAKDAAAMTTIPIVADLVGRLPVNSWVYYCVDDFSVWPGLDGRTLGQMENELLPKMDRVIAASESLADGIRARGVDCDVLTHGVDLPFWQSPGDKQLGSPASTTDLSSSLTPVAQESPVVLFWGVVDQRMNADSVLALADAMTAGIILLVGPIQDPDPRLRRHPRINLPGPIQFDQLPSLASQADVLIMPYADLPVTRAMQPLKLKEYLATNRPVVTSRLPSTEAWEDCLELADDAGDFVDRVQAAISESRSLPDDQANSRRQRLASESWNAKADWLHRQLFDH